MVGILVSCGDGPFSGAMFIFWMVTWCFFNPTSSDVVFSWSNIQSLQSVAEVRHAIPNTWKGQKNWSQSPNNQWFLHDYWLIVFVSIYLYTYRFKSCLSKATCVFRNWHDEKCNLDIIWRQGRPPPQKKKKQRKLLVFGLKRHVLYFYVQVDLSKTKTCANHELNVKKNSVYTCPKIQLPKSGDFLAGYLSFPINEISGKIMAKSILLCSKVKGQPEEVGRNAAHEEELQQIAKVENRCNGREFLWEMSFQLFGEL